MYYPNDETNNNGVFPMFMPVTGVIRSITDFSNGGCVKLFNVVKKDGTVTDFIVDWSTYFTEHVPLREGMVATFYYNTNVPAVLIYPPQFKAVVVEPLNSDYSEKIKVDYFNSDFVSSDNTLQINMDPETKVYLQNGQYFNGSIADRNLVVFYDSATKSIPAVTTPKKIIVLCNN